MRISDWSSDVCQRHHPPGADRADPQGGLPARGARLCGGGGQDGAGSLSHLQHLLRAAGDPARRQADRQRPSGHPHRQAAPALPGLPAEPEEVRMTLPASALPALSAILFDWDNTLVDSWAVIHHAMTATFEALGERPWPLEETRRNVRQAARDAFPALFGARADHATAVLYRDRKSTRLTSSQKC